MIPASDIVSVAPGVIDSGGSSLSLNGVILTKSTYVPVGTVPSFASASAVSDYFGPSSDEYAISQVYFLGYDNSTIKPGTLYFAPFADVARAAWLRSGSMESIDLATLKTYTGVLTVTVDGTAFTSSTINLSTATSQSNAATLITAAFTGAGKPTCTWDSINSTFSLTSSTTGATSTITYATGTIAASLKMTAATGATLSQGVGIQTPANAMDAVKAYTTNWVDFMTLWEPVTADKTLFAQWTNAQNQRYAYIVWDTDAQAIVNGSTTCFGYLANAAEYDAVMPVYNTKELAAFALATVASIDFSRTNGRITAAFKKQSGFTATVTDQQTATNLLANGYSFYGTYATANDDFSFLYNSQVSGKWRWLDTYIDQIYLNSELQVALMGLLTSVGSIPYNEGGYSLVRSAMQDPINAALNSGIIRTGITLSESQAAQVNQSAGRSVSTIIEQQGYYLQILDPGAAVRGQRGTPVVNFWYTDGGSIQKINIASIDIL